MKVLLFYFITSLPLLVLVSLVANLGYQAHRIASIDPSDSLAALNQHLEQMSPPDTDLVRFERSGAGPLIYVFGGSSVVLPDGCDGKTASRVFSAKLEDLLRQGSHPVADVFNFGSCAKDSFYLKSALERAVHMERPDLVIVYSGHNDYNNAYHGLLHPRYYSVIQDRYADKLMELIGWRRLAKHRQGDAAHFIRFRLEPLALNVLQALHLVRFDAEDFERYNEAILRHFEQNIRSVVETLKQEQIPLVLVTPIGNLEMAPFGIRGTTDRLHEQGLREESYPRKIEILTRAVDSETFTYAIRAKSALRRFLRSIDEPGVYLLDLELDWVKRERMIGNRDFSDHFHLEPRAHERIAELLRALIDENQIDFVRPPFATGQYGRSNGGPLAALRDAPGPIHSPAP